MSKNRAPPSVRLPKAPLLHSHLFVNNKMHPSVGKCVSRSLMLVFHKRLWSFLVNRWFPQSHMTSVVS
jgi:hypothetical protein